MALCPLPIRNPQEEKNRVIVPKDEQGPAAEEPSAAITSPNIPPAPEIKRKNTGLDLIFSIITAAIVTFLAGLILYLLDISLVLIWIIILILVFIACSILFFTLRKRH